MPSVCAVFCLSGSESPATTHKRRGRAGKAAAGLNDGSPVPEGTGLRGCKGAVTYFPTFAVSSAWRGLTSLFGMGRGGTLALSPPEFLKKGADALEALVNVDGTRGVNPAARFYCGCRSLRAFDSFVSLPERLRAISIARLWTLPPLHLRPIDVVVSDGPMMEILS